MKEQRQQEILNMMYRDGKVNVNELSKIFGISKDTIRRDLTELEDQGVLRRGYGGAIPAKKIPLGLDSRVKLEKNVKYEVAKKALGFIKPGSLIVMDGGSTNLLLASLMPRAMELTVVTNSFPVAEELRSHPKKTVIFLGGTCNRDSQVTVGSMVYEQLRDYHFDQCFLGMYGIDSKMGCSVPNPFGDEAPLKRYLVEHSSTVNVMGSIEKLDVVANYVICGIDEVDRILCEESVDPQTQERYQGKIV